MPVTSNFDWNLEASNAASYAMDEVSRANRGAFPWKIIGTSVVLGNDGFIREPSEDGEPDQRARHEAALVRDSLAELGVEVLGFGVDPFDGFSWAMIVRSGDIAMLNSLVWAAWRQVVGPDGVNDKRVVRSIAACLNAGMGRGLVSMN